MAELTSMKEKKNTHTKTSQMKEFHPCYYTPQFFLPVKESSLNRRVTFWQSTLEYF